MSTFLGTIAGAWIMVICLSPHNIEVCDVVDFKFHSKDECSIVGAQVIQQDDRDTRRRNQVTFDCLPAIDAPDLHREYPMLPRDR